MAEQGWKTYEEVATHLLDKLCTQFGMGRFDGKQILVGGSGTAWEIDAKGCADSGSKIIVVECKRHTTQRVSQALVGSLAFTIHDTGANGGILVSPLGLQEGAKKVAASANIVEVVLHPDSTTSEYMLKFLNEIHVGLVERAHATDDLEVEVRDKDGNIVYR